MADISDDEIKKALSAYKAKLTAKADAAPKRSQPWRFLEKVRSMTCGLFFRMRHPLR